MAVRFSRVLFLAGLCAALLAPGCNRAPGTAKIVAAQVQEPFPIPIVELRGSPDQIGAQHGRELSAPIHVLFDQYLNRLLGEGTRRFMAMTAATAFSSQLRPEHREEIQSLAAGASLDVREVTLGQCFLDLSPMTACSTITLPASASPDRVARFGRNLDFPSLNIADKYTTVFIYHPDGGRLGFAAVGWPGMVGVLSGMNESGLALCNMEVQRGARLPVAMPYTLLYRSILERCHTVKEAIELLQETPRQTANNLMLMDAAGDRAVVEITPAAVIVRHGESSAALISTNHQRGEDHDTPGRCRRYDFLHDSSRAQFGKIGTQELETMLTGASQGNATLQSMIFEPATRVLYLSAGKNAARGTFHRLDLTPFFSTRAAK